MSFDTLRRVSKYLATPPVEHKGPPNKHRRSYDAAKANRFAVSWAMSVLSEDQALKGNIMALKARAIELSHNDAYMRKFITMVVTNVVGPKGVKFQCQARDDNGKLDKGANAKIEAAWAGWGALGNCDTTTKHTWRSLQKLIMKTMAREGEVLIRRVVTTDNGYGLRLQLIDAAHLDDRLNEDRPDGSKIRMGVEMDAWGRPVKYHLRKKHPGDNSLYVNTGSDVEVIPASEIIHLQIIDFITQSRPAPWASGIMNNLKQLHGYEESEIIAARLGACKGGFYTQNEDSVELNDEEDSDGSFIQDVEPGTFEKLPSGWDFKPFDPQHPNSSFGNFIKHVLRGIAAGFGISYNTLANDLEAVNYSSIRAGKLEERDFWEDLQVWFTEHFCTPVFNWWLPLAMLNGAVALPMTKIAKFNAPVWRPRGWAWVDPEKEMVGNQMALQTGITSLDDVIQNQGEDPEEVMQRIKASRERLAEYGLEDIDALIYGVKTNAPSRPPS